MRILWFNRKKNNRVWFFLFSSTSLYLSRPSWSCTRYVVYYSDDSILLWTFCSIFYTTSTAVFLICSLRSVLCVDSQDIHGLIISFISISCLFHQHQHQDLNVYTNMNHRRFLPLASSMNPFVSIFIHFYTPSTTLISSNPIKSSINYQ